MPSTPRRRSLSRRDFLRVSAGTATAGFLAACTGSDPVTRAVASSVGPTSAAASHSAGPALLSPNDPMVEMACGLPARYVRRIARGYHPKRSGELEILPKAPNFVGDGLPHVGPWDYTSHVPMLFYGPGFIKPLGAVDQQVTSADISPTWAQLLGIDFPTPESTAITDILVPSAERKGEPKLILTLVWDGAGRNVLDEWPGAWKKLHRLIPEGAWMEQAEAGSSPTSSAQIHATIGTGVFPELHGVVGHSLRIDGKLVPPWRDGPQIMLRPTLADLYAGASGGRATMGAIGTVAIQLGMLGHGSEWGDNPKPLAVLRELPNADTLGAEGVSWNLSDTLRQWYEFPEYANDEPALSSYFKDADAADGAMDGVWREHGIGDDIIEGGFQSPARIPYQTRLIEEIIEREQFGKHDSTDLLFINFKVIDQIGHIFSLNSREMHDTLTEQDEYLPVLMDILDRQVGKGQWAMVVTADHGSNPNPHVSGAFQISSTKLKAAIDETFGSSGSPVVEAVKQTEIFMDEAALARNGATLQDVSEFAMTLKQGDLVSPDVSIVSDPNAPVFDAVFPSEIIPGLPCAAGDREKA